MEKNNIYIQEFKVDTSNLTPSEKKVLDKIIEAARLVADVYALQVNDAYPGANFYPPDATREEIKNAARQNPDILDPYTVVERKKGKLVPTPYHQKYRQELLPIAKLLKEAAALSDSKDFARRLVMQSNALLDGDYEAADIYWLTMKPYKIDIMIAPQERYEDRLLFIKNCYSAVVGVVNEEKTKYARHIKELVVSPRRRVILPAERVEFLDKLQLKVDNVLLMAGLDARCLFTAADFPNDPNLMEKHGAQLVVFGTTLDYQFDKEYYPIFQAIFSNEFQTRYTKAMLREASFHYILLHEIGHALLRYRDAEQRLKEFYPIIDEMAAYVVGIKSFGTLLLKDIITQKQLEALMAMFICRCFHWWQSLKGNQGVESFAKGHAIALNYFLENGAIAESNGISWPNFTKMYMGIDDLSDALERLLANGQYQDVKYFVNKFANFDLFEKFKPRLSALVKES